MSTFDFVSNIKFFEDYIVYGGDEGVIYPKVEVKISSRFMIASHIVAMLNFVLSLRNICLADKVKDIFWDENGCEICIDCKDETNIREIAQILYCAKKTMIESLICIKSFDWEFDICLEDEEQDEKYSHEKFEIEDFKEVLSIIKDIRDYKRTKKMKVDKFIEEQVNRRLRSSKSTKV